MTAERSLPRAGSTARGSMPASDANDPQAAGERRLAARHLLQRPLTCAEHDRDVFRLIRRHEAELDRWFTQRLGYRLHVDGDTARLWKSGFVPDHRPLRTASDRPLHHREYVLLTLVLAAAAAGPLVVSLRDLVEQVRAAAAEASIELLGDATERRGLVTVLRWMIDHGLLSELHAQVADYAADETADAVLRLRPDRIALLPLPALAAADARSLLERADRRAGMRQWLRVRLVEDPVVYAEELTATEWGELRRRFGEEERMLDEMFDLRLEVRAEGAAAIDPSGRLSATRFPAGGAIGHAALLALQVLADRIDASPVSTGELVAVVTELADRHRRHWSADLVAAPERLTRLVVDLLVAARLARPEQAGVRLLPAAARFLPVPATGGADDQSALW